MKIIKPSVEVFFHYPWSDAKDGAVHPLEFIEQVGRTCYKSESAIGAGTAAKFVKMLKDRGHGAMLEHCVASVKFVCDRGVSHEIVRHRAGVSYAQESTRYCNYSKDKFDREISVIEPPIKSPDAKTIWGAACEHAEQAYLKMIEAGETPEIARSVLPPCLKTEIWVTANLREWLHIFSLRTSQAAHPQIRELMQMAQAEFVKMLPEVFSEKADLERLAL